MTMFKTVANEVWACDAEWVPDPVAGRVLYGLSEALADRKGPEGPLPLDVPPGAGRTAYHVLQCRALSHLASASLDNPTTIFSPKSQGPMGRLGRARPYRRAAYSTAMMVMLSTISPLSTIRRASAKGKGRTSINSVSSGGSSACTRFSPRNRCAVSSMTLLLVW